MNELQVYTACFMLVTCTDYSLTMKMEAVHYSETNISQTTWCEVLFYQDNLNVAYNLFLIVSDLLREGGKYCALWLFCTA
jgi:hypothetical protein